MATIQVEVLRAGSYLDGDLNARPAQVGEVIEIFVGPYSTRIIALGCVAPCTPETTDSPTPSSPETEATDTAVTDTGAENTGDASETDGPDTDADPVGSLMDVNGIGQRTARKLVDAGMTSKAAFVAADPVHLSEVAGTTVAKVQAWQAEAARLLKELEEEDEHM